LAHFRHPRTAQFVAVMLMAGGQGNLAHYKKHRVVQRSSPKRTYDPKHPHVATARLLAQRQLRNTELARP